MQAVVDDRKLAIFIGGVATNGPRPSPKMQAPVSRTRARSRFLMTVAQFLFTCMSTHKHKHICRSRCLMTVAQNKPNMRGVANIKNLAFEIGAYVK